VASSAVGGPAHALYARGLPPVGLTSVRPARQVFLPQPVDPRGSTPRAWPGPGTRRAELGNLETIWRDSSARSNLRPEFDRSQVASRPMDRVVELGTSGEPYPSNGLGMDPTPVRRSDALPQYGYGGVMPNATAEARQMYSPGVEAGLVGLPPIQGAPALGPMLRRRGMGYPTTSSSPTDPVEPAITPLREWMRSLVAPLYHVPYIPETRQ